MTDIDIILSNRHINGGDFWATDDGKMAKGSPFSTYFSAIMLLELEMPPSDPILQKVTEMFFGIWREDGRFKLQSSGGIYPCHTAYCVSLLCRLGYAGDERIQRTFQYLLENTYTDGGWRCNKFSFGRGADTEFSNPLPTLNVLDAFRFSQYLNNEPALDKAVEFLLAHWEIKRPIGPCQYGIGTLFMQVEYPMGGYNIFYYVYVLSFYSKAKEDQRFLEALAALESKLVDGQIFVERASLKLVKSGLVFCAKGKPSVQATKRYYEILANLGR